MTEIVRMARNNKGKENIISAEYVVSAGLIQKDYIWATALRQEEAR